MNKIITLSTSTAVLSGLLMMTGCSSSDDAAAGGGAVVPANAITLTNANAEPTVGASVTTVDTLGFVLGVDATPAAIGLKDALAIIEPRIEDIKSRLKNSGADLVYGADVSESGACDASGTFSFNGHEGGTFPSFTDSGTVSAVNCDDGTGAVLNGNFSWVQSWNEQTGVYSDTLTGTFSVKFNGNGLSGDFRFAGIDYAETGNEIDQTYNVSKATFAIDLPGGDGYLVKLTAPIIESVGGFFHCPESGTILITGANGTTAEGIYNGDGTMTIKANGTVVNATANCVH